MKLIRDKTVSAGKHAGAEEMDSKWGQGREEKWTDDTSHERGLLVEPRRIVKISVVFFFSLSLSLKRSQTSRWNFFSRPTMVTPSTTAFITASMEISLQRYVIFN